MSKGFASAGPNTSYGATESRIPEVSYSGTQFSPTEMFDLSENITANIYNINSSWKQLEQALKTIGTQKDSQALRDKVHITQSACNKTISQTTKDIQRLTVIVRKGDAQQKLQVDKLTNSFKESVQKYSRIQKQVAEKMRFSLLESEVTQSDDNYTGSRNEEEYLNIAKQKMVTRDLEFETGMLVEREQRIKQIEDDILDINQIMRELGSLVHEQSDSINTIENSIETIHDSVEAGAQELEKASSYQDKRRRKTCYLVGISVVVGIILAIIVVVSVRK